MEKQEKIVSAAVLCTFELWETCEKFEQVIMCINYDDGIVKDIKNAHINEATDFISSKEGFITNKNRFVNAKEAMEIAIKVGQTHRMRHSELKPSDLY